MNFTDSASTKNAASNAHSHTVVAPTVSGSSARLSSITPKAKEPLEAKLSWNSSAAQHRSRHSVSSSHSHTAESGHSAAPNKSAGGHKIKNFLYKFRDSETKQLNDFTAAQFLEVWNHYDSDRNGFIEGSELDGFLREFITAVVPGDVAPGVMSDAAFMQLKQAFMDAFDENADNKISISEMAQILPTEQNFLVLFRRDNPVESSVEFMKIWRQFDKDNSGYIEADELKEFLRALLRESRPDFEASEEKLIEYTDTMLALFDANRDGRLQFSELARLLPVRENYLCRPIFKNASLLTSFDIDRVFQLYDRDGNGIIEDEELNGLLKDLLELVQEDYDEEDLTFFRHVILEQWDVNHDGKISRDELKMILLQQSKIAQEQDHTIGGVVVAAVKSQTTPKKKRDSAVCSDGPLAVSLAAVSLTSVDNVNAPVRSSIASKKSTS